MTRSDAARLFRYAALAILITAGGAAWSADASKAAEYYENGLSRYEDGDRAGAIIQLKNALQQNGNMLSAHVLLAKVLLDDLQLAAAEAALEKAMSLGVSPGEVAVSRARLMSVFGRHKELLDRVHTEGLMGADRIEVMTLRAKARAVLGETEAALAGFREASLADPASSTPYLEWIPYLFQLGRLDDAAKTIDALEAIAPTEAATWNLKASLLHIKGRLPEALEAYDEALKIEPKFIDARVARASIYLDAKQFDAMRADLDYLHELVPDEARANYLRAVLAGAQDDSETVRASLTAVSERIDSLPPEYTAASEQLLMLGALAHHGLNVPVKAKGYLDRLLARYPANMAARKLLAGIYLDERDSARAIRTIEPLLRHRPDDPQGLLLMGRAHLIDQRFSQANRYLERAAEGVKDEPRTLAALGYGLLGSGNEEDGIAHLKAAFQLDPGNGAVGMVLATAYMRQGAHGDALAVAQALVKKNPKDPVAHNLLGALFAAQGDVVKAQSAYDQALTLDAAFEPAKLNLARLDMAQGHFDAAQGRLEAMSKARPDDGRIHYELGRLAQLRGDTNQAIDALRTAVAKDRADSKNSLALIDVLWSERRNDEALSAAKEAALRHRENMPVLATLARAHHMVGDAASARQALKDMTRLAEFDPEAQVRIGRMYLDVGAPDDAEYNVQKARTSAPDFVPALALGIEVALAKSDAKSADKQLAALAAAAPDHPDLPSYEGRIAWLRGDQSAAVGHFKRANAKVPSPEHAMELARAQYQRSDAAGAIKTLEGELSRQPTPGVRRALVELLMREQRWADAQRHLNGLVKISPRDAGLHNALATVLFELKDPGALATAETARQLAPKDPLVADTLGWIKLNAGDVAGALNLLRDARLRAPTNREIRFHLAQALHASGRTAEARKELDAALADEQAFPGRKRALELRRMLKQ